MPVPCGRTHQKPQFMASNYVSSPSCGRIDAAAAEGDPDMEVESDGKEDPKVENVNEPQLVEVQDLKPWGKPETHQLSTQK